MTPRTRETSAGPPRRTRRAAASGERRGRRPASVGPPGEVAGPRAAAGRDGGRVAVLPPGPTGGGGGGGGGRGRGGAGGGAVGAEAGHELPRSGGLRRGRLGGALRLPGRLPG